MSKMVYIGVLVHFARRHQFIQSSQKRNGNIYKHSASGQTWTEGKVHIQVRDIVKKKTNITSGSEMKNG